MRVYLIVVATRFQNREVNRAPMRSVRVVENADTIIIICRLFLKVVVVVGL
jgi:hypothetical protein